MQYLGFLRIRVPVALLGFLSIRVSVTQRGKSRNEFDEVDRIVIYYNFFWESKLSSSPALISRHAMKTIRLSMFA